MSDVKSGMIAKVKDWILRTADAADGPARPSKEMASGETRPPPKQRIVLQGGDPCIIADGHLELKADLVVLDRELGSCALVHCLPSGTTSWGDDEIQQRVEDGAYLKHLMVMRNATDHVAVRPHGRQTFLWSVEIVFVVSKAASDFLPRIRSVLPRLKAQTELLHAIGINLAVVGDEADREFEQQIKRGFSWLLTDVRAWLKSDIPGRPVVDPERLRRPAVRELEAVNFRLRGPRKWALHRRLEGAATSPVLLHVMHGPNGSGKSTLAEAFEFAVTGASTRLRQESGDLGPLVFGGGTTPDGPKEATIRVSFDSGGPISQRIQLGDGGGLSAATTDVKGAALRFDEDVCDTLLESSERKRMAFWLQNYFPAYINTRSKEDQARKDLRVALDALGIRADMEVIRQQVAGCFGSSGSEADMDWHGLVRIPVLELGPDAWAILESADRDVLRRLDVKGPDGRNALREVLERLSEALRRAASVLSADFGRYLEELGEFVLEGRASALPDDKDPKDVYSIWLENVARVDLLDSALKLGETLKVWMPPNGDILKKVRVECDLHEMERARVEAVRERDDARLWLSKHRDSRASASSQRASDAGLRLPDLALLEGAAKAGAFGELLGAETVDRMFAAFQSGQPILDDIIKVGSERGWTAPLIERREALLRLRTWMEARSSGLGHSASWLDRAAYLLRHLGDLADAVRALQGVNEDDAQQFKQITQKLPEALQELVELMTPASWAYERMDVKVGLDVAEVGAATLTMQARGMELEDVLNTAEKNAVALAMHLLCAPKADNPYRITFLDDPFQNMDELTVTITARALSKLLRLMGSTGKYPGWEFVLLLHGADDCERVVQEVPSVFYRIPWNSPDGAAGTASGASAGDVEHVRGVGSTRADLFDCVTFMGLAWDETRGLVDPKAEAQAKEPKAKTGA